MDADRLLRAVFLYAHWMPDEWVSKLPVEAIAMIHPLSGQSKEWFEALEVTKARLGEIVRAHEGILTEAPEMTGAEKREYDELGTYAKSEMTDLQRERLSYFIDKAGSRAEYELDLDAIRLGKELLADANALLHLMRPNRLEGRPSIELPFFFPLAATDLNALNRMLQSALIEIGDGDSYRIRSHHTHFRKWRDRAYQKIFSAIDQLAEGYKLSVAPSPSFKTRYSDLRSSHSLKSGELNVRRIQEQAEHALQNILLTSGTASTSVLSEEFRLYSEREKGNAFGWTCVSILLLLAIPLIAFLLVGNSSDLDWQTELARLAVTLPILAVSGYAARLANHHRENARHARWVTVQLKTIRSYCDGLDDDDAKRLKMVLGERVFARPDFVSSEQVDEAGVTLLPKDIIALVEKVADVAKR